MLLERCQTMVSERQRMMKLLQRIPGVNPWPSQANFILMDLPQGRGKAIFDGLCRRGIFLRYFSSPRLRDSIRASIGLPQQNDAVAHALAELVKGGS